MSTSVPFGLIPYNIACAILQERMAEHCNDIAQTKEQVGRDDVQEWKDLAETHSNKAKNLRKENSPIVCRLR